MIDFLLNLVLDTAITVLASTPMLLAAAAALLFLWLKGSHTHPARRGARAERYVARTLRRELGERAIVARNWVARTASGDTAEIDIVIVGPTQTYVVEVKSWKARVEGEEGELSWTLVYGKRRRFSTINPLRQAERAAEALAYSAPHSGAKRPPLAWAIVLNASDLPHAERLFSNPQALARAIRADLDSHGQAPPIHAEQARERLLQGEVRTGMLANFVHRVRAGGLRRALASPAISLCGYAGAALLAATLMGAPMRTALETLVRPDAENGETLAAQATATTRCSILSNEVSVLTGPDATAWLFHPGGWEGTLHSDADAGESFGIIRRALILHASSQGTRPAEVSFNDAKHLLNADTLHGASAYLPCSPQGGAQSTRAIEGTLSKGHWSDTFRRSAPGYRQGHNMVGLPGDASLDEPAASATLRFHWQPIKPNG